MIRDLVVLGAGYAGVLAALRAARRAPAGVRVRLVNESDHLVERVRLHEALALGRAIEQPLARLCGDTRIELVRARAFGLDARAQYLETDHGRIPYDALIVAVGSGPTDAGIAGAREHGIGLDVPGARRGYAALATAREVAVIGGGLSAVEVAAELAEARPGLVVRLFTGSLLAELGDAARARAERVLGRLGVRLHLGEPVREIDAHGVHTEGSRYEAQLSVLAAGQRAAAFVGDAGLAAPGARASVDGSLRSSLAPNVFVVGDAAEPVDHQGVPYVSGCKSAMPQGAHIADAALALLEGRAPAAFGWFNAGYCVSLGRRDGVFDAQRHGAPWFTIGGAVAAWLKERICRYTLQSLEWERSGRLAYRWPQPRRVRASLDAPRALGGASV
jgi:NADH:ubiquinone reductase (H+-translocating)